ncbi:glycosyltransferase family 2 protein [Pseudosulfitobacter pseudonitzschiae]|uniref:glycosyltransferase family 2 protein n=1 Tax=Pseudosulfitobacter pseudonitzschiae TaxID=1402135 RepID=UPI003B78D5B4
MRISIIMPSYNQSRFVEAAIQSVLSQEFNDLEVLFIDGGSTDGTMDIVDKYRDRLALCISERDKGQSDALHKGFCRATGDLVTWLNTDDLLLPGALFDVERSAKADPECEWFLGNVMWIDSGGGILRCRRGEAYAPLWPRLGLLTAAGPSAFFSRALYDRVGGINKNLNYQMDTELWWRFIISGARFRRLRDYTWALRLHAEAKVSGHLFQDKNDPQAIIASAAQMREAEHVNALRDSHLIDIGPAARRGAVLVKKALSPSYLRSITESRRWDGKRVNEVFGI